MMNHCRDLWLRVDTLSPLVDLQPRLCHLRLAKELKWHPHQVSLDLVELLPNILGRDEAVKNVTGLDAFCWSEMIVVFKGFD